MLNNDITKKEELTTTEQILAKAKAACDEYVANRDISGVKALLEMLKEANAAHDEVSE